MFNIASLL